MKINYRTFNVIGLTVFMTGSSIFVDKQPIAMAGDPVRISKGQSTRLTTNASTEASYVPVANLLNPTDQEQIYTVEPIPVRGNVKPRTPEQERALTDAAAVVSKVKPIPADRTRYFGWMNSADSPVTFAGWGIFIEKAILVPEGWLITLRAHARAISKNGRHAEVENTFVEYYLWDDRGLIYLRGHSDPRLGSKPIITF